MQVDRKKLKTDKQYTPDWHSAASAGAAEEYEAPSTALEEKIQKVWQEVLGQEKISVAADFFQIGGNSLRVSQPGPPQTVAAQLAFPVSRGAHVKKAIPQCLAWPLYPSRLMSALSPA